MISFAAKWKGDAKCKKSKPQAVQNTVDRKVVQKSVFKKGKRRYNCTSRGSIGRAAGFRVEKARIPRRHADRLEPCEETGERYASLL